MSDDFIRMELTTGQVTFFLSYAGLLILWAYSELIARLRKHDGKGNGSSEHPSPPCSSDVKVTVVTAPGDSTAAPRASEEKAPSPGPPAAAPVVEAESPASVPLFSVDNPVTQVLRLDQSALLAHRMLLRAMVEFGAHLSWYFLCDRTSLLFPSGKKSYSRDLFWFIYLVLIAHTVATSLGKNKSDAYLNREQTEEWKGMMQVLFLMYHYFNAAEQYNAIRVYIAAYVWMTGFGNFSFYYVRKDFSAGRFFQMIWRLNFLVFWVCIVLGNDYMCYYICGMHTLWTFFVYFSLFFFRDHNENNVVLTVKFGICIGLVLLLFSSRSVWDTVWAPLYPLVQYVNPRAKAGTPGADPMHEWFFRAGLDRFVWMHGMLMANLHPRTSRFLEWVDSSPQPMRTVVRVALFTVLAATGYAWYSNYFVLGKLEYNQVHPYTSFIPITVFILLRNLTPLLRNYSMHFFGFLGKITLETYIGQYHIWMLTEMPNGQPKSLMVLVPDYPLLNFAVCTALYIWVSLRLFDLTNQIKVALLPSKDDRRLYRNVLLMVQTAVPLVLIGKLVRSLTIAH